ncbi:unnamed protein product, partial [Iphiclides podalirius]
MLSNQNTELKSANVKLTLEKARLQKEISKLKDDKFAEYLMLMRERDARYTLYHENLTLELKIKELMNSAECHQERGDPVVLRIALDRCREQLSATQGKLTRMTEEYSETVPRRQYDALENGHLELGKKLDALRTEYEALESSYRRLAAQKKSLQEELVEIKERCRELERAGTPRPQWELCADFIGGGRDRWWQLAGGLSSRKILMVLLKELGPAAETEHLEYFDGLVILLKTLKHCSKVKVNELKISNDTAIPKQGTDPAIPPYLRYEGKVRNLRLSRREISVVVNDIWSSKLQKDRDTPMQEYVTRYFEERWVLVMSADAGGLANQCKVGGGGGRRYGQASVRAEWAYSVCAGAEQALDEPSLRLFWGALRGRLCQRVYWAHRRQCAALSGALRARATTRLQTVTMEEFQKVAKATFPLKSEVDINNLADVVRKQLKMKINQNVIDLDKLFYENEEGFDRLDIARELFRQKQMAQDKYIREIIAELGGRRALNKLISVDNLKRAFAIVDPAIDHIRMESNIRWAFSDETSELGSICPVPLRTLVARLAAGNIERVGPRHRRTYHR